MNYLKNCPTLSSIALFTLFFLGTSSKIIAQEDVYLRLAKFSILVETSGDVIKLTCNDGCTWKQLNFNLSLHSDPQAIDQYGLTTLTGNLIETDSLNSDFLFTIKRTPEGISLEGKAGTSWQRLIFCDGGDCFRTIDEHGMESLKKK